MERSMENNSTSNGIYDLSANDMQNVYKKLSYMDDICFDERYDNNLVVDLIEKIFDDNLLKIDTKELQSDSNKINSCLATLIKICFKEKNFKKPGLIFINFCDYFDLDYCKTYECLHDKIKFLVENSTKILLGKNNFQKHKIMASQAKHGIDRVTTLFDL